MAPWYPIGTPHTFWELPKRDSLLCVCLSLRAAAFNLAHTRPGLELPLRLQEARSWMDNGREGGCCGVGFGLQMLAGVVAHRAGGAEVAWVISRAMQAFLFLLLPSPSHA